MVGVGLKPGGNSLELLPNRRAHAPPIALSPGGWVYPKDLRPRSMWTRESVVF